MKEFRFFIRKQANRPGNVFCKFYLFLVFPLNLFAQESNQKEDYSAFVPEVLNMTKFFAQTVKPGSILTKEGLAKERSIMQGLANSKTTLKAEEKTVSGPFGPIRMLIYRPDTINGLVLDIHGGAWIMGNPESDAQLNDEMARACKVAVVSIDYHLAPEFPFPACIEDCKAAAAWIIKNMKSEFGTEKLIISGSSAGAHLSALTAIYIRDSLHAINKVKGISLFYGCFDLGRTPSSRQIADNSIMLNKKTVNELFQVAFSGWTMEKIQQPEYSPIYADLKGLPPAIFTAGTADPLLDDSYFMEDVWRRSGNQTYLALYPECPHAFNYFPTKMAKLANEKVHNWIKDLIK